MENETLDIKINNFFSTVTTKPLTYYKGIRMKADTGLHAQIAEIICRNFPVLKNMGGGADSRFWLWRRSFVRTADGFRL